MTVESCSYSATFSQLSFDQRSTCRPETQIATSATVSPERPVQSSQADILLCRLLVSNLSSSPLYSQGKCITNAAIGKPLSQSCQVKLLPGSVIWIISAVSVIRGPRPFGLKPLQLRAK